MKKDDPSAALRFGSEQSLIIYVVRLFSMDQIKNHIFHKEQIL
jgi:hypothetical protein